MAPKEVKKLVKQLQQQGWRVEERGNRFMAYSPDGVTIVSIHKTPSDHRWLRNTIAQLRQGGFDPDA